MRWFLLWWFFARLVRARGSERLAGGMQTCFFELLHSPFDCACFSCWFCFALRLLETTVSSGYWLGKGG